MSYKGPLKANHEQKVIKSDAHVGQGASSTQLENQTLISKSESESQEQKQDSLVTLGSKEENEELETKGNNYEEKIGQLTKSLSEKEKEITDLKEKLKANKALLKLKLKEKDEAYNKQEAIKLELERELAAAEEEVTLLKESPDHSRDEELKKEIGELKKEINEKAEKISLKDIKIKHLEQQLTEKEKCVFNAEASDAADKREKELMMKQVEDLKKENERNIGEATQYIDELVETREEQLKEKLKEIDKLREENTMLKGTVEEQGNMREKLTELEALGDKVAASHEEEINLIRREEETKRAELEEELKRKFRNESQQRAQSYLQETEEVMEGAKKKYEDRFQANKEKWQAEQDKLIKENNKLKEELNIQIEKCSIVQDSLDRKSNTSMELAKQIELITISSAEKDETIKQISERLQLREAENELFKQDFLSERNDRVKINDQLIKLQAQYDVLKQESAKKEREVQTKFHSLKQSNSDVVRDLEKSKKEIATKDVKIESLDQKIAQMEKKHTEEIRKIKKKLKESETGETDRLKVMEEEIQVLTAQVNAYSREVDKQKGLVTQSQEKHKTEIEELKEKFDSEMKAKEQLTVDLQAKSKQQVQQLQQMIQGANERVENEKKSKDNELARMRQQLDDVSADKEELLSAYYEEQAIVTRLKGEMEKMKQANIVLNKKLQQLQSPSAPLLVTDPHGVRESQHASHPLPANIDTRQNFVPSAPVPGGEQVVQSDGDGVLVVSKTEGVTPVLHTDSTSIPDDAPHMSKEEVFRMFSQQGSSDWMQSPQQVEDSLLKERKRQELARKADDAVLDAYQMRESRQNVKKQSSFPTEKPPPPSQQTSSKQKTKRKAKNDQAKQQASDDSDSDIEENKLIDNIDEEIQQMAEDVRKGSRGPSTAEVLFDDGDSSLPYDPNLVCPKCGKQYRVGEIQKLRRHINEFCTGMR